MAKKINLLPNLYDTTLLTLCYHFWLHYDKKRHMLYLVVVAVSDGVGVNTGLLHLKQDPDCQDRLAILSTQLHQYPVTDLHS